MKLNITISILALSAHAALGITTNDVIGNWIVTRTTSTTNASLGVVRWSSISFASNEVSWTWSRDGQTESHKGKFRVITDPPPSPGIRQTFRIVMNPITLDVPNPITLKDVRIMPALDCRFPAETMFLVFINEDGRGQAFRKRED